MKYNTNDTNPNKPDYPHRLDFMWPARREQLERRKELLLETLAYALPEVLELFGIEAEPDERQEEFEVWRIRARRRARLEAERGSEQKEGRCR